MKNSNDSTNNTNVKWTRWYVVVLLWLLFQIAVYTYITNLFNH